MNKADIMERFVAKAGFADAAQAADMVRRYKASPDGRTLTFGEWAVMTNTLTPDQTRTVIDFFDNSRFQCLECGANVYGREFEDRLAMFCPHCGSREFQLRGTARAADATHRTRRAAKPPGASAPSRTSDDEASQSYSELISRADMAETQAISRAPKLPGSGKAPTGVRVVEHNERKMPGEGEQPRRRVPLEVLQILKGRSIDEFLQQLDRYPLYEWRAATTLIVGLNRRDLVPAALEDGKRRLADLALLSLLTRSMPRLASTIQAFVYELVQETAVELARLGAFLASQDTELERSLAIAATATGGTKLREAQQHLRERMAGEVTDLLAFFLDESSPLRILSRLQQQYTALPESVDEKLVDFLESPEPFVRAMIAYSAVDPHSPIPSEALEARIQEEHTPFVTQTLQTALDRRMNVEAQEISTFERVLILKRTPLFSGLRRDNLINVAGVANERRATAGETIILQDTPGDAAYILVDGEVDVLRLDADDTERHLASLKAPQVFGEMAILN